jgi:hypothetical protein
VPDPGEFSGFLTIIKAIEKHVRFDRAAGNHAVVNEHKLGGEHEVEIELGLKMEGQFSSLLGCAVREIQSGTKGAGVPLPVRGPRRVRGRHHIFSRRR